MEAQRKAGGFEFGVMPMVAETMRKLGHFYQHIKDGEELVIQKVEKDYMVFDSASTDGKPAEGKTN